MTIMRTSLTRFQCQINEVIWGVVREDVDFVANDAARHNSVSAHNSYVESGVSSEVVVVWAMGFSV